MRADMELRQAVQLGLDQLRKGEFPELEKASLPRFFAEAKAHARR